MFTTVTVRHSWYNVRSPLVTFIHLELCVTLPNYALCEYYLLVKYASHPSLQISLQIYIWKLNGFFLQSSV